jgi:hypothetical protein
MLHGIGNYTRLLAWTLVELTLGVVAASLPTVGGLFTFPRFRKRKTAKILNPQTPPDTSPSVQELIEHSPKNTKVQLQDLSSPV